MTLDGELWITPGSPVMSRVHMEIVENLMERTAEMPMKQIDVNGAPYLQRYYAGTFADGSDLWIHRFLSCDGDRHLHSHPFNARSIILCGWYDEETPLGSFRREPCSGLRRIMTAINYSPETVAVGPIGRAITVFDWHRIAQVAPETWTAFIVEPARLPVWFFKDDSGNLEPVAASDRKWWLTAGNRPGVR